MAEQGCKGRVRKPGQGGLWHAPPTHRKQSLGLQPRLASPPRPQSPFSRIAGGAKPSATCTTAKPTELAALAPPPSRLSPHGGRRARRWLPFQGRGSEDRAQRRLVEGEEGDSSLHWRTRGKAKGQLREEPATQSQAFGHREAFFPPGLVTRWFCSAPKSTAGAVSHCWRLPHARHPKAG